MEASVREVEDHFDIILYETCAREAFDIGGVLDGAEHPNMLIIIEKYRYLVTGIWGLALKDIRTEDVLPTLENTPLSSTLYIDFKHLNNNIGSSDFLRCIVPVTSLGKPEPQGHGKGKKKIWGLAGVYRRFGNVTTFALVSLASDTCKEYYPVVLNKDLANVWLKGSLEIEFPSALLKTTI